ncbi:MAG TPA: hypothetical protein PKG52_03500 [bacterium]|nr:hypothetical protein [bacterium]HPS28912.1 hypothetical protein [bacterium]
MTEKIGKFLTGIPSWYLIIPVFLIIGILRFSNIATVSPVSEESRHVVEVINGIKPGSKIMVLVNYGPEGRAELEESLSTLITTFAKKEVGIVFATMVPAGIETISMSVEKSLGMLKATEVRYVYGRDYINLGYIAGGPVAAGMLAGKLTEMRKKDVYGNELKNMPVMNGINSFEDFSGLFEFSSMKIDDVPGAVLISMMSGGQNVVKTVFCTSDNVAEVIPFLRSGSINAMAGGFRNVVAATKLLNPYSNDDKRYFICTAVLFYILIVIVTGVIGKFLRGRE